MNKDQYLAALQREVLPATGCTEPIAAALACARAREILGEIPKRVILTVSRGILKNAMAVGIPGTSLTGLEIAACIGIVCGKSDKQLRVIEGIQEEDIACAKRYQSEKRLLIQSTDQGPSVYVQVLAFTETSQSEVILQGSHTGICLERKDDKILWEKEAFSALEHENAAAQEKFSFSEIVHFCLQSPLEDLKSIYPLAMVNEALSQEGMREGFGHRVGPVIEKSIRKGLLGDDLLTYVMKCTAAATDARMSGCPLPAMSNSGSGNQGITVTMPVIAAAQKLQSSQEQLTRALMLSSLMAIYIKSRMPRLSALCGAVTAGTAASAGITYLLGGGPKTIEKAVKNMIGTLSGLICDGAKPNCAMKVASGACAAVLSSLLAVEGVGCEGQEGIIDEDVDQSIENLAILAEKGMVHTDAVILATMLSK